MSNGDPPPVSGAPYIIICSRRIDHALASNEEEEIQAASRCAADLTAYLQVRYRSSFNPADCENISVLQHALMDHVRDEAKLSKDEVDAKVQSIFSECDALEQKYVGVSY
jgi:hypothetical protein